MMIAGFPSVLAQTIAPPQDLPPRDQNYLRDVVSLSRVIGSAHAIRITCNGVDDQYWRSYMQQLLGLESPNRSSLRTSMVEAFNRGYQLEERRHRFCDDDALAAEAAYAAQGRELSEDLAAHYFPRRR